jgi:hypothetical protein
MSPFLANTATEFTDQNQRGIAWALEHAYDESAAQTDPDEHPSFATPLRASVRGSIRWNHVQAWLQRACEEGRIVGFVPSWKPTGGNSPSNRVLELSGGTCALTAVHVSDVDDTPRDAAFRRDARGSNQLVLESIEDQLPQADDTSGKVSLLLVHGGHDFEFAEIRCYYGGEEDRSAYTTVVGNLERWRGDDSGGALIWADEEPVVPPTIILRDPPRAIPEVAGD